MLQRKQLASTATTSRKKNQPWPHIQNAHSHFILFVLFLCVVLSEDRHDGCCFSLPRIFKKLSVCRAHSEYEPHIHTLYTCWVFVLAVYRTYTNTSLNSHSWPTKGSRTGTFGHRRRSPYGIKPNWSNENIRGAAVLIRTENRSKSNGLVPS